MRGSFWRFRPLAPAVCEVTYCIQVELGGSIPKQLLAMRTKGTLSAVQQIQDKYERKGKLVDAELRAAFPSPPRLEQLDAEQKQVVESCRRVVTAEGAWAPLAYKSPFVTMLITYAPPKKGERSVATGKAETLADCSAATALAWFFAYNSRERVRTSIEERNPARLTTTETTPHDIVVATIKAFPFKWLPNREFFCRLVAAEENGTLLLATESVSDVIDYGTKNKNIRGITRGLICITPVNETQCKVILCQYADAAGFMPTRLVNSALSSTIDAVDELRQEFQRDDEIDKLERDELARSIQDEQQTYTAEEDVVINKVNVKLGLLDFKDFEELESLDHLVKMGKIFVDGSSIVVGRASVTIDASVEQCAAWDMAKMNREQVRDHGSLERSLTNTNDHNSVYHVVYDLGVSGFQPREFLSSLAWRRQGDKLAVVYNCVEHEDFPPSPSYVRGTNTTYFEYEKLQPVGNLPQTRVTFTTQVDLGGIIPKSVVNRGTVDQLMYLSAMRKRFDRSLEIDGGQRARNVAMITRHEQAYSEFENLILTGGEKHFTNFKEMKAKELKMVSPLTKAEIAFKSGDRHAWGRATATVRASPEEVLAYMWDVMKRCGRYEDDLEKAEDEQPNDHNTLSYNKKRTPKIIADRDFLGRGVWKKTDGGFFFVTSDEESADRPIWRAWCEESSLPL